MNAALNGFIFSASLWHGGQKVTYTVIVDVTEHPAEEDPTVGWYMPAGTSETWVVLEQDGTTMPCADWRWSRLVAQCDEDTHREWSHTTLGI